MNIKNHIIKKTQTEYKDGNQPSVNFTPFFFFVII